LGACKAHRLAEEGRDTPREPERETVVDPSQLSRKDLECVVRKVQEILYRDDGGEWHYLKECTPDALDMIGGMFESMDLAPKVRFRKGDEVRLRGVPHVAGTVTDLVTLRGVQRAMVLWSDRGIAVAQPFESISLEDY
jgi:hypothetical protein